jgi:hypothetical protein
MNQREKKFALPAQLTKLNSAVETLAHLDFQDPDRVQATVQRIRWELAEVNLDLCEILNAPETA